MSPPTQIPLPSPQRPPAPPQQLPASPPQPPAPTAQTEAQRAARVARWAGVRRVLAVRLDNLGDVVMTTPALAAIRDSLPGVHLTLLASPSGALVAPHLEMVDSVWAYSAPWVQRAVSEDAATIGRAEAAIVDRLAEGRFDAAVIFTVCTQSALPAALLCRMAGIPLRLAHSRENPYGLLTDWLPECDQVQPGASHAAQAALARHEVERQLALVAAVGLHTADERLRFAVRDVDRQSLAGRLADAGLAGGTPYAVICPGATAESRRWPARSFGQAAEAIAAGGCTVVFSGDRGEIVLAAQALQAMSPAAATAAVSLAGLLNVGELAALIEGAQVVVANNSAPAHLAAAVGTPLVNLYALTNPQHTPWRVPVRVLQHDVPCRWCLKSICPQVHNDCLRRIEPARVVGAAFELMRSSSAAARGTGVNTP